MKLGIIGSGMIVKTLLPCISKMEEYSLEAIASRKESTIKNQELADKYNIKKVYGDYQELLNDKEVEVVYVALPNHMHYAVSKDALEANKHVICEKPFMTNDSQLEELDKLAKEKGLFLLEAIATNFYPSIEKVKQSLALIGKVKIVEGNYGKYSSRYTAFREGKVLPTFDVNCSGGCLMDINIYNLHILTYLFGEGNHIEYHANVAKGVDTSGIILVDHDDFKAVLVGSKDSTGTNTLRIQAEDGTIEMSPSKDGTKQVKIILKEKTETFVDPEGTHYMYYEFKEFARIIKENDKEKAEELMDQSMKVMRQATIARHYAGVYYPDDNK